MFNLHAADMELPKADTEHLMGSGVIVHLKVLGGRDVTFPFMISDGLSKETIEALRADIRRTYNLKTDFKPKGV